MKMDELEWEKNSEFNGLQRAGPYYMHNLPTVVSIYTEFIRRPSRYLVVFAPAFNGEFTRSFDKDDDILEFAFLVSQLHKKPKEGSDESG